MLKTANIDTFHHGSEIEYLAETAPEFLENFSYAWITGLDSGRGDFGDSPDIKSMMDTNRVFAQLRPGGLLMDIKGLMVAATEFQLFNSFEEVWFVCNKSKYEAVEDSLSPPPISVSEIVNATASEEDDRALRAWMDRFGICFGLADGVGASIVTTDDGLHEQFVRIHQDEAAAV